MGCWVHFLVPFLRVIGNSKPSKDGIGSLVVHVWMSFVCSFEDKGEEEWERSSVLITGSEFETCTGTRGGCLLLK